MAPDTAANSDDTRKRCPTAGCDHNSDGKDYGNCPLHGRYIFPDKVALDGT